MHIDGEIFFSSSFFTQASVQKRRGRRRLEIVFTCKLHESTFPLIKISLGDGLELATNGNLKVFHSPSPLRLFFFSIMQIWVVWPLLSLSLSLFSLPCQNVKWISIPKWLIFRASKMFLASLCFTFAHETNENIFSILSLRCQRSGGSVTVRADRRSATHAALRSVN